MFYLPTVSWVAAPLSPGGRLPHPLIIADDDMPPLPPAIERIADPTLRVRATEAWAAASRLAVALDQAHEWFGGLRLARGRPAHPGPDPGVFCRCRDAAERSVRALGLSGVRASPFDRGAVEEIAGLLPTPSWSPGGPRVKCDAGAGRSVEYTQPRWQDDERLWSAWYQPGQGEVACLDLLASACELRESLEAAPLLLLTPDPLPALPKGAAGQGSSGMREPGPRRRPANRSAGTSGGRSVLIAILTKHHAYATGGCLNQEPIGCNQLAGQAGVSQSTASDFFRKQFDGYARYRAVCRDVALLAAALKLMNGEFTPSFLYGRRPVPEGRDEE